jgi:hypothetical protein
MHRSILALGSVLIALAAFGANSHQPSVAAPRSSDEAHSSAFAEQLVSLEKALSEAQKKHDRNLYKTTLTDDFISVGTDGKVHPKDEILGDFPSTQLAEYRPYNIQVVQLNENAAIVTYDVIVRMVHYDDETPRYQHVSSIWVKQGDQWKLKFQQATAAT